jgi:hypothetical protein
MQLIQADEFPGRCKNLRPCGYEMLRCLEAEGTAHTCRFPESRIKVHHGAHSTLTPMTVKPWVVPE